MCNYKVVHLEMTSSCCMALLKQAILTTNCYSRGCSESSSWSYLHPLLNSTPWISTPSQCLVSIFQGLTSIVFPAKSGQDDSSPDVPKPGTQRRSSWQDILPSSLTSKPASKPEPKPQPKPSPAKPSKPKQETPKICLTPPAKAKKRGSWANLCDAITKGKTDTSLAPPSKESKERRSSFQDLCDSLSGSSKKEGLAPPPKSKKEKGGSWANLVDAVTASSSPSSKKDKQKESLLGAPKGHGRERRSSFQDLSDTLTGFTKSSKEKEQLAAPKHNRGRRGSFQNLCDTLTLSTPTKSGKKDSKSLAPPSKSKGMQGRRGSFANLCDSAVSCTFYFLLIFSSSIVIYIINHQLTCPSTNIIPY